jgi:hypothetical protein
MLRLLAVLPPPKIDEAEDLLSLLAFADVGIGIAKYLGIGIGFNGATAGVEVGRIVPRTGS